jgi:hypothetical protein
VEGTVTDPPRVPREHWPWWVKVSLIGSSSRRAQWFWAGASAISGAVLLALAATQPRADVMEALTTIVFLIAAVLAFVAAAIYWSTIRWMDRHGDWEAARSPSPFK